MLFAVTGSITSEASDVIYAFQVVAHDLSNHLASKVFGSDIKQIYIGLICVSPEFKQFFKLKKDRYTNTKKEYIKDGFKMSLEKAFQMEIELPYETIVNSTVSAAMSLIASEIIQSLGRLKLRKKLDFDTDALISEIQIFFKAKNIL